MIAVPEPDARSPLLELDAIEDAASDVARTFERIPALAGDQDRLLSGLELTAKALVAGVSQKASTNRGDAGERHVEIDEGVVRIAEFRVLGSLACCLTFQTPD